MEKCSNCKNDIEKSKFAWHETMCKQTMRYCDVCKEAISIEEFEEHLKEHPASLPQPQQPQVQHKEDVKEVKAKSVKQEEETIVCMYCQLHVLLCEYDQHDKYCAEQREECVYCAQEIKHKDMKDHEVNCMITVTEEKNSAQIEEDAIFARQIADQENLNDHIPHPFRPPRRSDWDLSEAEQLAILYAQFGK